MSNSRASSGGKISNLPSGSWLVSDQKIHSVFGMSDNRPRLYKFYYCGRDAVWFPHCRFCPLIAMHYPVASKPHPFEKGDVFSIIN